MADRIPITTNWAPKAIGPYSQAIRCGGFLFASGQVAPDPATGELLRSTVEDEVSRVLENLGAVLRAGGSGLDAVVKTTVFLVDMADFAAMNEVYARHLPDPWPSADHDRRPGPPARRARRDRGLGVPSVSHTRRDLFRLTEQVTCAG